MNQKRISSAIAAAAVLCACGKSTPPASAGADAAAKPAAEGAAPAQSAPPPPITRADFNYAAAELALPLFWLSDAQNPGQVDPGELAVLWGIDNSAWNDWIAGDKLSPKAEAAIRAVIAVAQKGHDFSKLEPNERARRELLVSELRQGYPTLLYSDFSTASAEDRMVVENMIAVAKKIEEIYAKQLGVTELRAALPADDTQSRMVFYRNQMPWCTGPTTQKDERCNALATLPKRTVGLYPASLQTDATFCDKLAARPDQKDLLAPFVVVSQNGGDKLKPVPYPQAFNAEMTAVSELLQKTANGITDANEAAFKTYLLAAAKAFTDNNWAAADEAWAKMSVKNSKWYLRVGPDETYYEPCNRKAGFHMSFARINPASLTWQEKLEPQKGEMENELAKLAGAPYKARKVSFHLPDFIDIVLNAGDSRDDRGGTLGQSLPNWGAVANEGRGRTVVMTNLYEDPDSKDMLRRQIASVFCAKDQALFPSDSSQVMSTVLHEAAHNLGPAHEYKVKGKVDDEIFGGQLATLMEELKAQTSALYFTGWLADKKVIEQAAADSSRARDFAWGCNHIALGLYDGMGQRRPYGQLASIQLGYLLDKGAVTWNADELAGNGSDKGCLALDMQKVNAEVKNLMTEVARIKAKGDKAGAEALIAKYVDDKGAWDAIRNQVGERWRRFAKASFVYSIRL